MEDVASDDEIFVDAQSHVTEGYHRSQSENCLQKNVLSNKNSVESLVKVTEEDVADVFYLADEQKQSDSENKNILHCPFEDMLNQPVPDDWEVMEGLYTFVMQLH